MARAERLPASLSIALDAQARPTVGLDRFEDRKAVGPARDMRASRFMNDANDLGIETDAGHEQKQTSIGPKQIELPSGHLLDHR